MKERSIAGSANRPRSGKRLSWGRLLLGFLLAAVVSWYLLPRLWVLYGVAGALVIVEYALRGSRGVALGCAIGLLVWPPLLIAFVGVA